MVVVRYARRPAEDVAFIGGIDLDQGSRDDADHRGDRQSVGPDVGHATAAHLPTRLRDGRPHQLGERWMLWSNSWEFGFIGVLGASHARFYSGGAPRDLAWPSGIRR